MLISIVVPTYNRGHLILSTVESVVRQTFEEWELVIVDDGSTDNTETIVKTFQDPRIRYFRMDKNHGAPYCRNYGFLRTSGEYVGFLDSDDAFHEDRLLKHWQLLKTGDYDCVVSRCQRHNHVNGKVIPINNIEPKENLVVEFINKSVTWNVYPIWKKTFLTTHRILFDEDLKNSQDYQFNCFAVLNRPKVGYIHEYLAIKNEYDLKNDPSKIRTTTSLMSLKSHLRSRMLVIRYARNKELSLYELREIKTYVRRHRVSCYYRALRLSFMTLVKLFVFSLSLKSFNGPDTSLHE